MELFWDVSAVTKKSAVDSAVSAAPP